MMTPGNYLPTEYLPVLIMMIVAAVFGAGIILIGGLVRLRRPYKDKLIPYESGITPVGEPGIRFRVSFYIVAMLFVIFDVEAVFLYPWAIVYDKIGLYALIEMLLFIAILLVGYVYAWKKGAFVWDSRGGSDAL
jgi:NADH-quinone oxidoreductase subunit A